MANLDNENTELDETNTDTQEDTTDTSDSTQETSNNEDDEDEISYEQAIERKKKADRLQRAEKALVEYKRAEKEAKKHSNSTPSNKEELRRILAEERFFEKNTDAELYRSEIEKYKEKGLSLEESYILATQKDKEIESNRAVYGKSIVKGEQSSSDIIKAVSLDVFDRMTEAEQNKYTDTMMKKYGVVKF